MTCPSQAKKPSIVTFCDDILELLFFLRRGTARSLSKAYERPRCDQQEARSGGLFLATPRDSIEPMKTLPKWLVAAGIAAVVGATWAAFVYINRGSSEGQKPEAHYTLCQADSTDNCPPGAIQVACEDNLFERAQRICFYFKLSRTKGGTGSHCGFVWYDLTCSSSQ